MDKSNWEVVRDIIGMVVLAAIIYMISISTFGV